MKPCYLKMPLKQFFGFHLDAIVRRLPFKSSMAVFEGFFPRIKMKLERKPPFFQCFHKPDTQEMQIMCNALFFLVWFLVKPYSQEK